MRADLWAILAETRLARARNSFNGIFLLWHNQSVWSVEYTDEFGEWWDGLTEDEQDKIAASVGLLVMNGPTLDYPHTSAVNGSKHSKMRELRVQINGRDAGRVRAAWYPYTYPFNLTGHPALTVPCGFTRRGLPLGLHLVGRWYAEDVLLHLGIELTSDESGCCSTAVMAGFGSGRSVRELPMRRC